MSHLQFGKLLSLKKKHHFLNKTIKYQIHLTLFILNHYHPLIQFLYY